ncbi:cell division protein ZapA [Dellaglioa sp. BT-FLS60]
MEKPKNRYKTKIGKKMYTIVGSESDLHMDAVATLVKNEFQSVKDMLPEIDDEQAAMLVAINAVSDQIKLQEKLNSINGEAQVKE